MRIKREREREGFGQDMCVKSRKREENMKVIQTKIKLKKVNR